jgi:hypothetical protein
MSLKTADFTLNRNSLPAQRSDVGIRLVRQMVETIKASAPPADKVLVTPASNLLSENDAVGPEPRWNHLLCGIGLQLKNGTVAAGAGQFVITGRRFIGMIDSGTLTGSPALDVDTSGHIYCFTINRDDVYPPAIKKHRLKPSEFTFRSTEEQEVAFQLVIYAAWAYIANKKMNYWHDKNMLRAVSDEGRESLLRE